MNHYFKLEKEQTISKDSSALFMTDQDLQLSGGVSERMTTNPPKIKVH